MKYANKRTDHYAKYLTGYLPKGRECTPKCGRCYMLHDRTDVASIVLPIVSLSRCRHSSGQSASVLLESLAEYVVLNRALK